MKLRRRAGFSLALPLALLAPSLQALTSNKLLPPKFPKIPLDGLFQVVESRREPGVASIDRLLASGYEECLFFPGQRVRFVDKGPEGSERPHRLENEMTLYPPFNPGLCHRMRFMSRCDVAARLPETPIVEAMTAGLEEIDEDFDEQDSRLPLASFGARKGRYIYYVRFTDRSGLFILYFQDWETLINLGTYWDGRAPNFSGPLTSDELNSRKVRPKTIVQILKRIPE
jgi:hypothetical protein